MDQIKHAIEQQDYQNAYDMFHGYLGTNPVYTDTLAIIEASIYMGLNYWDQALDCIENGLKMNPVNSELYFMLGNMYEFYERYDKAYLCYENALYHCKDNEEDYLTIEDYFLQFINRTGTKVPPVSIVILTFNGLDYTRLCIDSIRKYCADSSYEILCVDNGSSDNTGDWLKNQPDIRYHLNHTNLGFAAGCNIGIRMAAPDNDIFLLNNDTILTENALFWLRMGLYDKEEIGAAGSVSNRAGNKQTINVTFDTLDEYLEYGLIHNVPSEQPLTYCMRLVGFAFLIKRVAVNKTGELDERFFPGCYEDDDYSIRLILNDYKLVFCRNSFIFHYCGKSFDLLKDQNETNASWFGENRRRYIDKWHINPEYSLFSRSELVEQIQVKDKWKPISCLDIGCACGSTLLEIQNSYPNARLYGIELNPACAEVASHIAAVVQGNVETIGIPFDVDFDCIILGDILEHLVEPEKLLKSLKSHLSDRGVIIASIPNILHFSAIGEILKGSFEYTDAGVLDRTHLRFFTLYNCIMMLQNCGYEIVAIQRLMSLPSEQQAEMETLIKQLARIPGVVDIDQFLTVQYIFKCQNAGM